MAKATLPHGTQHHAFKGQAYPNAYQAQYLKNCMGCSRYIYNALLHLVEYSYHFHQGNLDSIAKLKVRPDLQPLYWLMELKEYQDEYAAKPLKVGPNQMCLNYLIACLKSHPDKAWLSDVPRTVLSHSMDSLLKAFQGFYRLVKLGKHIGPDGLLGFPNYKGRYSKQSIRLQAKECQIWSDPISQKRHTLRLPHCRTLEQGPGLIRIRGLKKLHGIYKSIAITCSPGQKWLVSILTVAPSRIRTVGYGTIGIDLSAQQHEVGYCQDAYQAFQLSQVEQLPKAIPTLQARVVHLQRLLARKTKGGQRKQHMRVRLAKAQAKLARLYEGYYHRLTNWLLQTYDSIAIEDLDTQGMLQRGRRPLSKLIQDSRFGLFKQMLQYKLEQSDRGVLGIADRFYPSSQICSTCQTRAAEKLPLHVRHWTCEACGAQHHRDYNAAANLYDLYLQSVTGPMEVHKVLLAI